MDSSARRSPAAVADEPADATVTDVRLLAQGYCRYERLRVTKREPHGTFTVDRDVLRVGKVAAVLAFDPARCEVVLLRQFRLAAHLATGRGDVVEIVAGRVEPGENVEEAARRECQEEIGLAPDGLVELFSFLPTPGVTDEQVTVFLGIVDASDTPESGGAAHEEEHIRPIRIAVDDAVAAIEQRAVSNGLTLLALQWLALNRDRLDQLAGNARGR